MSGLDLSTSSGASTQLNRTQLVWAFWAAAALSFILPRIPFGRNALYPFALLGVWAHEMGHGLTSILTGGDFIRLELYKGLGGVAFHSGAGRFTGALVSAGGLLGPAIFGGLIIVLTARPAAGKFVLPALSVMIALSIVFYVRNGFGIFAMSAIAAVLIPVAFKASDLVRVFIAQLIGIQFCLASWGSWDYLFTDGIQIDGRAATSDTGAIADALFLPYWFWGALIGSLSVVILVLAFFVAWVKPFRAPAGPVAF